MRDQFPLLSNCVYLNTAYTAPLSQPLYEWRKKDELMFLNTGDLYKKEIEKTYYTRARAVLSKFIGSQETATFITANFSVAFQNFVMHLPPTTRVLVLEEEYPSLTGVLNDMGFPLKTVPVSGQFEQDVWQELHKGTYEVLALSVIQYTSGLYFDLSWLEKIKTAFPDLLILADGTQFIGAEPFDFSSSAIDAIFGSTYKWLMAGYGTGYAVLKPELMTVLESSLLSFETIFDRGHLSINAVGSLSIALTSILKENFSALMVHKKALSAQLSRGLLDRNLLENRVKKRHQHSSIFNLKISPTVFQGLLENNVRCIWRGEGARIAVHHYNSVEDISRFFKILDQFL
ncbi:MAG: aminotransferase class V-fold PLP-dependent enzyme [Flavobacteriaceae bacterium]